MITFEKLDESFFRSHEGVWITEGLSKNVSKEKYFDKSKYASIEKNISIEEIKAAAKQQGLPKGVFLVLWNSTEIITYNCNSSCNRYKEKVCAFNNTNLEVITACKNWGQGKLSQIISERKIPAGEAG